MPTKSKATQAQTSQPDGEFVEVSPEQDPVVDFDELDPLDLLDDPDFRSDLNSTQNDQVAGEQFATPFLDAYRKDERYRSPSRQVKASTAALEPAHVGGDAFNPLADLVQETIKAQLKDLLSGMGINPQALSGTPIIDPSVVGRAHPAPPSYKKHYRCDNAPDLRIQKLDMTALDRDERPGAYPLSGQFIRFRRGHLYTSDDNEIRQIEYMRTRPMYSPDGEQSLGGNPAIYEDDGGDIFRCTQGCDYITASKNAWKAHMKSTHGMDVSI